MKEMSFVIGFIWLFTSITSLVFGLFFIDRKKLKSDLVDYWNLKSESSAGLFLRRSALFVAWSGFLFPVIHPFIGLIAAAVFILLS